MKAAKFDDSGVQTAQAILLWTSGGAKRLEACLSAPDSPFLEGLVLLDRRSHPTCPYKSFVDLLQAGEARLIADTLQFTNTTNLLIRFTVMS